VIRELASNISASVKVYRGLLMRHWMQVRKAVATYGQRHSLGKVSPSVEVAIQAFPAVARSVQGARHWMYIRFEVVPGDYTCLRGATCRRYEGLAASALAGKQFARQNFADDQIGIRNN
jgi:hypothetical protein